MCVWANREFLRLREAHAYKEASFAAVTHCAQLIHQCLFLSCPVADSHVPQPLTERSDMSVFSECLRAVLDPPTQHVNAGAIFSARTLEVLVIENLSVCSPASASVLFTSLHITAEPISDCTVLHNTAYSAENKTRGTRVEERQRERSRCTQLRVSVE